MVGSEARVQLFLVAVAVIDRRSSMVTIGVLWFACGGDA